LKATEELTLSLSNIHILWQTTHTRYNTPGDTALLHAIRRGNYPIVLLLVESYGADVNVANFTKETPLLAVNVYIIFKTYVYIEVKEREIDR